MTGSLAVQSLRQRVIRTAAGRVHLWTGGRGPAVILIHGSPGNAWLVKPIAERLARSFCVYAIDTPGFGGSDALPDPVDSVAQLADAYRDILDSLELATVLVYGTHSGAAIGLELAHRHPARVSGFVLEGVPAFTLEEQRPLLAPEYLVAFEPDVLGGQYSRTWTRFHDQFVWFPWYQRAPEHLNEANAGAAADIHLWVEMYFQASRHDYRPAYRAVISYGAAAVAAASAVRVPGVYMAERSDMLFTHLDRLPSLHEGQRIERVEDPAGVPERIEAALLSLPAAAPGVPLDIVSRDADEYFHDLPGGQMLVRSRAGPRADSRSGSGTPVLLLHDAPGAGRQLLDLFHALSAQRPVLLPDLPCCGESDPLEVVALDGRALRGPAPGLGGYVDAVAGMLAARAGPPVHVHAIGIGAAVALELNARHPELVASLSVTGLLRTPAAERRAMIGRLAPPIVLTDDGSHWYRTWLMLRDSLVRWPWYAREPAALRRQPLTFDPEHLHAWTCDVMRQYESYHRLIDAVLEWQPEDAIERAGRKLTLAVDSHHALRRADLEWAATGLQSIDLPDGTADRARALDALVG
jgi:pimeloyl-ACP methyl ester carboxylesterase